MLLGDSFSVGANVLQQEAYPHQLELLLNGNGISHKKIEVINAGVGGWEPFQYAQYYEHYGHRFSPDLILIGFYVGNDTYTSAQNIEQLPRIIQGRRVSPAGRAQVFIRAKVWLSNYSHLARLLFSHASTSSHLHRQHCDDFSERYLSLQQRKLKNHHLLSETTLQSAQHSIEQIVRIQRSAQQNGIPVHVILIPDESQLNQTLQTTLLQQQAQHNRLTDAPFVDQQAYDFTMPTPMLVSLFNNASIPVLDLLPAFLMSDDCHYMNDSHWNASGHKLAAQAIKEYLNNQLDH